MKKRFSFSAFAIILAFALLGNTAFAAGLTSTPSNEPSGEILIYNPDQADVLLPPNARGAKVPTTMYNLDGQDYAVSGTFDTTIYTEYYFYPNANGVLYWNFTFTWQNVSVTEKYVAVQCWDKTENRMVAESTFALGENADGTYGPAVTTGSWRTYDLDPTHQYYYKFTKSFDGFNAIVTGTIRS